MQKMPCKKKKYNSRFPPARIKKIMQSDDEVGKVAAVVPIIISRVLEIFVENLLKDSCQITRQRNARTLTPAHIKASILQSNQLDFLKEIVSMIPDLQTTSGDDEQIDFNHQTHSNYADYYSSSNNSNHHKFIKQYSHPATNRESSLNVESLSGGLAINNLDINNLDLNSLNKHDQTAPFLSNSKTSSKRFKNTYSRSNSAPCTSVPHVEHLINSEVLRGRKKVNRLKRDEKSTNFEDDLDEDDELDESLSDDSNDNQTIVTLPSTSTITNQSPHTQTTTTTTNKPVTKLEMMEDDDYDA